MSHGFAFAGLINLDVGEVGADAAVCRAEVLPWLEGTPEAGIQGAAAGLADIVLMFAASTRSGPDTMPVTVSMRLDFWSPPPPVGARLTGTARVQPAFGDVLLLHGQIQHGEMIVASAALRAMLVPYVVRPAGKAVPSGARRAEIVGAPCDEGEPANRRAVEALLALPAARMAGLETVAVNDGAVELLSVPGPDLERNQGVVHGGAVPVIGSLASAMALASALPDDGSPDVAPRRLDLTTEYLRPVRVGTRLRVRSGLVHRTRRLAVTHTEIVGEDGKPAARLYETALITDSPNASS